MTLTPAQWDKIYKGVPDAFESGARLTKLRSQQYVNRPRYPVLVISIISQGIPVSEIGLMKCNTGNAREVWGQNCRARISAVIESPDIIECGSLASQLVQELYADELGINPIQDGMQFRGADPPQNLPPVRDEWIKKLVQRFAVDFFVEYEFTWQKNFDTIQKVVLDLNGEAETSVFDWETVKTTHSSSYLVDVVIDSD